MKDAGLRTSDDAWKMNAVALRIPLMKQTESRENFFYQVIIVSLIAINPKFMLHSCAVRTK